ncbi:marine proteobacterial sortase target protein [Motilimonas pumila]|uniref:Marine proteobacterial sortase target protein n=1 Tax=Motilimonas pumila TaxID=2303987 RepID=A0A418YD10_9GAMM|nr:marine proteobacterial sortase target protein [Motilimonas pumila]RJG42404.1 marine proteobacterial sortase target protein [Motilimonas pumila]
MKVWLNNAAKLSFIIFAAFFISNLIRPLKVQAQNHPSTNDYTSAQLLLIDDAGQYLNALSLSAKANIQISGLIAYTELTQSFKNDSEHWLEGLYVFPLAEHASVSAMEIRFRDKVIKAEIKEKQQAEDIYQAAKKAGKVAALTEQHRPNLFRHRMVNIAPGETVQIRLVVEQALRFQDGLFSYRLPTTYTPRYRPATLSIRQQQQVVESLNEQTHIDIESSGWAKPNKRRADSLRQPLSVTPSELLAAKEPKIPQIEVSVTLDGGGDIAHARLLNHPNSVEVKQSQLRFNGILAMDRDFLLQWQLSASETPQAALFNEDKTVDGETYQHHLLMLMPPQALPEITRLAKERVFVIDTSGSMHGDAIEQAKAALQRALTQLDTEDTFNIIAFSSSAHALFNTSRAANEANLSRARHWVADLEAEGGTEMGKALAMALPSHESHGLRVRQVIFMTDGAVSNEQVLFQQIRQNIGRSKLFTVGIGQAPNDYFMRAAAYYGGGEHLYVSHTDQVDKRLGQLFKKLSSPVLTNIHITSDSESVELSVEQIQDLYLGEPLFVAIRSLQAKTVTVTGFGIDDARTKQALWQQRFDLSKSAQHPGVANYWARKMIAKIERQSLAGLDRDERKEQVLPLALGYQLLSPYTSFVAVAKAPIKPKMTSLATVKAQNKMSAAGVKQLAFPKTATSSLLWGYWSLVLALLAFALWLFIRQLRRNGSQSGHCVDACADSN